MCKHFGLPLPVYEERVGPAVQAYHELAETVLLHAQGVFPLDPDERDEPDMGDFDNPNQTKIRR